MRSTEESISHNIYFKKSHVPMFYVCMMYVVLFHMSNVQKCKM